MSKAWYVGEVEVWQLLEGIFSKKGGLVWGDVCCVGSEEESCIGVLW